MREIKCRSWDGETFTYFNLNDLNYEDLEIRHALDNISDKQLGTGIKDYDGKEIYEGDILQDVWNKSFYYPIKYSDQDLKFIFWDYSNGTGIYNIISTASQQCNYPCRYRVIGNIYENPELLERR